MKRILPIDINPIIKSYPYFADYLCVLQAKEYDISGILFNNFLTLYYTPFSGKMGMRKFYYMKSLFQVQAFQFPMESPIEVMVDAINNGKYISVVLDEVSFDSDEEMQKKRYYHDCMIYGYNEEKQAFNAISYFNGIFTPFAISFTQFLRSIPNKGEKTGYEKDIINNHFFWIDDNFLPEKIDLSIVRRELSKYLYGIPPFFFNCNVYKRYCQYLKRKYLIGDSHIVDLKNFSAVYEHKYIVYNLMKCLSNDHMLIEEFHKIYMLSHVLLMKAVKFNIKNSKENIDKIIIDLLKIDKEERVLLMRFLKEIRTYG